MNNLFIRNIFAGILILESANGMQNLTPQYTPNNSGGYNAEGNEVFLPVTNGVMEGVSSITSRRSSISALELQQNSTNGQYINQFFSIQKSSIQNTSNVPISHTVSEINENTQKNINSLPILRDINSINQSVGQGSGYSNIQGNNDINLTPEQYNYLGYFPLSGIHNLSDPAFNLSEVLQLVKWQTGIIRKKQQELSNLKWQNKILNRENQRYKNEQKYFLPYTITQLKDKNTNLEKYAKNQDIVLQEAIHKQKNQQDRIICLEQRNKNNQIEIAKLKKQINKLKNQITKEKASHETEVNNLREQLKKEKQLNAVLNLNTDSVLENK